MKRDNNAVTSYSLSCVIECISLLLTNSMPFLHMFSICTFVQTKAIYITVV